MILQRVQSSLPAAVCSFLLFIHAAQAQSTSRLTGLISDRTSAPVGNVLVTLSSLDRAMQARSTADGRFQFENVPGGEYELEFAAYGFVKKKIPIDLSGNLPKPIAVVLEVGNLPDMSSCGAQLSFSYGTGDSGKARVSGLVLDYVTKAPILRSKVSLWQRNEKQPVASSKSDQTGSFKFDTLPAGRYVLRISKPGYWPWDVKEVLVTRESPLSIEAPLLKRDQTIACE